MTSNSWLCGHLLQEVNLCTNMGHGCGQRSDKQGGCQCHLYMFICFHGNEMGDFKIICLRSSM